MIRKSLRGHAIEHKTEGGPNSLYNSHELINLQSNQQTREDRRKNEEKYYGVINGSSMNSLQSENIFTKHKIN